MQNKFHLAGQSTESGTTNDSHQNDRKKNALLDIQKKPAEVLKIERKIEMINQENELDFFYWIYKKGQFKP